MHNWDQSNLRKNRQRVTVDRRNRKKRSQQRKERGQESRKHYRHLIVWLHCECCVCTCVWISEVCTRATWGGLPVPAGRARQPLVRVGGSIQIQSRHAQQDGFLHVVHHCEAVTVPKRQTDAHMNMARRQEHMRSTWRQFYLQRVEEGTLFTYTVGRFIFILSDIEGATCGTVKHKFTVHSGIISFNNSMSLSHSTVAEY